MTQEPPRNPAPFRVVVSTAYVEALAERSRLVIAEAERVIEQARRYIANGNTSTDTQDGHQQRGGKIVPADAWLHLNR